MDRWERRASRTTARLLPAIGLVIAVVFGVWARSSAGMATSVVWITAPVAAAKPLARAIIEKGLAACVNIVPQVRGVLAATSALTLTHGAACGSARRRHPR